MGAETHLHLVPPFEVVAVAAVVEAVESVELVAVAAASEAGTSLNKKETMTVRSKPQRSVNF